VAGRNNTSFAEDETRIYGIYDDWVGNRIDLVKPNYLGVPADYNFIATTKDIQVSDSNVISYPKFVNSDYQVQMANPGLIFDCAFPSIDKTKANLNPLSDLIAKEPTIARALQSTREKSDQSQRTQSDFTWMMGHQKIADYRVL
jgi:hypothetical protein